MSNSSEVTAMLQSPELRQRIVRSLCSSTVALFALFPGKGGARLELAGSGTLVFTGNSHCILTAAHVWEEVLKKSAKIGIELTDNISHRCLFATVTIPPTVLKPDSEWSEWGPDLALLRIPPHRVGGIKAFKVFEDVKTPTKAPDFETIGGWVAIGTPAELGSFMLLMRSSKLAAASSIPLTIKGVDMITMILKWTRPIPRCPALLAE